MTSMTLPTEPARTTPGLRGGDRRWVSIRPIERSDAAGLSDLYASLSPPSRRSRFLGTVRNEVVAETARTGAEEPGFVAVLAENGPRDGEIIGHVTLLPVGPQRAEVAVVVADGFQRRGIGTMLVRAAVGEARAQGIRRIVASTFVENRGMRRLLLESGCRIERDTLDACVEELELSL